MTLLTERPATPETTPNAAPTVTAVRGGNYVTLPGGRVPAGAEGNYVTAAGAPNLRPVTRGSYVTVDGTPVVAANAIEGSYVTLPAAA